MKRGFLVFLVGLLTVVLAGPGWTQYGYQNDDGYDRRYNNQGYNNNYQQTNTRTQQSYEEPSFTSPVGISLFDPVQWPDRSSSIAGVRFNLIYAQNKHLTGLDLGLLFPINRVSHDMTGVQFGLYNGVGRNGGGWQWGVINYVGNDFTGIQTGLGNITYGHIGGWQLGIYNQATTMSGLQLGVLNITDNLNGVQIGLGNFKYEPDESFPASNLDFFPVFNWSF